MRPVISAVMIVLGVSVCGALGEPVAGDATASLLKEVPREQVEALAASIAGRTQIVDWHGTWDYATIQAALNAAESGDTIIVLPSTGSPGGAYVENITIPAITLTLRSINPQDPAIVAATVIDGNQAGSVVTVAEGATEATQIEGFTIRNGTGTMGDVSRFGAGIFCDRSSPTIANNRITGNTIYGNGAGVCCLYGSPIITNNAIIANTAYEGSSGRGAGICCLWSSATIANNTISNNTATTPGGGIYAKGSSPTIMNNTITGNSAGWGGGVYCTETSPLIAKNTILANNAGQGGGIYSYSSATITNNMISENTANWGGGVCAEGYEMIHGNTITRNSAIEGGGIFIWGVFVTIANGTLVGNAASGAGGAIWYYGWWGGFLAITNCTLVANYAPDGGAIYATHEGWHDTVIANTIIAFNSSGVSGVIGDDGGLVWLTHNCVFGNTAYDYLGVTDPTGTDGNISADPLFRSADPGPDTVWGTADDVLDDLRLQAGSPCIDAGNNADVPADTPDLDGDGDTSEALPFDLAGWARFFDDPATVDTGLGTPPIVDMGAYESHECLLVALAWRSVRTHGAAGDLGIALDPAAGGAGVDCEPRQFGVQRIEVAFNTDVSGSLISLVAAEDLTHGGSIAATDQYTINGGATLVLEFKLANPAWPASPPEFFGLPDETCYRISLAASIAGLCGDTDCEFRVVAGNTNGDDRTNLADIAQAKLMNGQPLLDAGGLPIPENGRFDVNLDGVINLADMALVKLMNGNGPVACP